MTVNPFQVKNMLRTYGRQLTSARRLAKFRRSLRMAGAEDSITISREARRRQLVERIAREIMDNLLVSGSDSPIVSEVKKELERDIGARLFFKYPLAELEGDLQVQIFKETPKGDIEVTPEEGERILSRLWQITMAKVDETML